jgi:hypothetical protein
MNIDGNGTRNELARADATGHMRISVGHACVPGRAESGGDCCVLPVPSDSGIIPVLFYLFSFLSLIQHLAPLDMPGDILKKRKIAVLGSRSVGEPGKFIVYNYMLIPPSATSGKSSLVIQFTENQFIESYYPTIENTFTKSVSYKGVDYDCDIIDTAGQVCTRVLHVTLFALTTPYWKGRVFYPQFKACHWNPWFCSRLLGHLEKFPRHDPDRV